MSVGTQDIKFDGKLPEGIASIGSVVPFQQEVAAAQVRAAMGGRTALEEADKVALGSTPLKPKQPKQPGQDYTPTMA